MRFQIIDNHGNVVDQDLTYEEALMWVDSHETNYLFNSYSIRPMKESDQNDCGSL